MGISWEGGLMTHAELVAHVLGRCGAHKLQAFYWPDSRKARRRGWPDFSIGGPGGWIFREIKPAFGIVSGEQRATGYMMTAGGLNWKVWRPADWDSLLIERELRAVAGYVTVC